MKQENITSVVSLLGQLVAIQSRNQMTLESIERLLLSRCSEASMGLTQQDVVRKTQFACREAGIPNSAFSLKTVQRMELGKATPRAGYDKLVRYSEETFQAWLNGYIAEEVLRLRPEMAVRYRENLSEHNKNMLG